MRFYTVLTSLVSLYVVVANATELPSLLDATIDDLVRLLDAGTISSVDLVNAYISRIDEVNDRLHAVMEINPTALEAARESDLERAEASLLKQPLGLLHGVPILIKDNIATLDMNNTAGSVCMLGSRPKQESLLITKLRRAGAVILGKTNMSEWAGARAGSYNSSSNGWSGYGGQCYGAFVENQDPSGSSSGSAVAVSVGLSPIALGTETSGSITSPADHANLVGLKPTMGLTSRHNVVPITARQDTVGPLCHTVSDCALILSILAGKDENDNATSAQPFDTPPDYTKALNISSLQGARIGVPWNHLDATPLELANESQENATKSAFHAALKVLEEAGAEVVSANYTYLGGTQEQFWEWLHGNGTIVWQADMPYSMQAYLDDLEIRPPGINTVADIMNCTKHDPRERYPEFDMGGWDAFIEANETVGSSRVWQAYQNELKLCTEGGLVGAIDTYNLDALVMPTLQAFPAAAPIGAPLINVPLGVYGQGVNSTWNPRHELKWGGAGIPFGMSFVGKPWSEEKLIGLAYAFEQKTQTGKTIKPVIVPTTELKVRGAAKYNDDL